MGGREGDVDGGRSGEGECSGRCGGSCGGWVGLTGIVVLVFDLGLEM